MLNKDIEEKYIVISLPDEYRQLRNLIIQLVEESSYKAYLINEYDTSLIPEIPANVMGVILYNDKSYEFGLFLAYLSPFVSQLFVFSEEGLVYTPKNITVYSPKYKKLKEVVGEYLHNIDDELKDISIDNRSDGYTFIIKGAIKINPYKGMLISFDHPNFFNKLSNGGNEMTEAVLKRLRNEGIECIDLYTPTEQVIGGMVKSALYQDFRISKDTLQTLFMADRMEFLQRVEPLLKIGKIVITNYSVLSNLAYSYKEIPLGFILAGNSQMYWPDISFVVKSDSLRKMGKPHLVSKIFDTEEKQNKINEGFKKILPLFSKTVTPLTYNEGVDTIARKAVTTIKKHYKFRDLQNEVKLDMNTSIN